MKLQMPKEWVQAGSLNHKNETDAPEQKPGSEMTNHYKKGQKLETPKDGKGGSTHTSVTARINMSADVAGAGLCPECREPMEATFAAGHPVWSCKVDRISIPRADGE